LERGADASERKSSVREGAEAPVTRPWSEAQPSDLERGADASERK
jgi:hypothetical protein